MNTPSPWSDATSSHPSTPATPSVSTTTISFTQELLNMMHASGECSSPSVESAQLIEKVLYQHLRALMQEVIQISNDRQGRSTTIGLEEFVFMLRRDHVRLARLMRYLDVLDTRTSLPDEESESLATATKSNKRRHMAFEFLAKIDPTGELESIAKNYNVVSDPVKRERLKRSEQQAFGMTTDAYFVFHTARQNLFGNSRHAPKLRDWIMQDIGSEVRLTKIGLEVLAYFANETLNEIMDLCFLVLDDWKSREAIIESWTSEEREEMRRADIMAGRSQWVRPQQSSLNNKDQPMITPKVVKEALRRFSQATGPFSKLKKEQPLFKKRKLLSVA